MGYQCSVSFSSLILFSGDKTIQFLSFHDYKKQQLKELRSSHFYKHNLQKNCKRIQNKIQITQDFCQRNINITENKVLRYSSSIPIQIFLGKNLIKNEIFTELAQLETFRYNVKHYFPCFYPSNESFSIFKINYEEQKLRIYF